jgi:hypothetical protein
MAYNSTHFDKHKFNGVYPSKKCALLSSTEN